MLSRHIVPSNKIKKAPGLKYPSFYLSLDLLEAWLLGLCRPRKQQNTREMKHSGARSAPGIFGVFGVKKQIKHREMKQSGARSAPENRGIEAPGFV